MCKSSSFMSKMTHKLLVCRSILHFRPENCKVHFARTLVDSHAEISSLFLMARVRPDFKQIDSAITMSRYLFIFSLLLCLFLDEAICLLDLNLFMNRFVEATSNLNIYQDIPQPYCFVQFEVKRGILCA